MPVTAAPVAAPKPSTSSAPSSPPPPRPAPPAPSTLDAKVLAALADDIAALKSAKAAEGAARKALASAADDHAGAVARLDMLRAKILTGAASLAGADLADNFVVLTDSEAAAVLKAAQTAKQSPAAFVKARIAG